MADAGLVSEAGVGLDGGGATQLALGGLTGVQCSARGWE